jgi:hypothetical protein
MTSPRIILDAFKTASLECIAVRDLKEQAISELEAFAETVVMPAWTDTKTKLEKANPDILLSFETSFDYRDLSHIATTTFYVARKSAPQSRKKIAGIDLLTYNHMDQLNPCLRFDNARFHVSSVSTFNGGIADDHPMSSGFFVRSIEENVATFLRPEKPERKRKNTQEPRELTEEEIAAKVDDIYEQSLHLLEHLVEQLNMHNQGVFRLSWRDPTPHERKTYSHFHDDVKSKMVLLEKTGTTSGRRTWNICLLQSKRHGVYLESYPRYGKDSVTPVSSYISNSWGQFFERDIQEFMQKMASRVYHVLDSHFVPVRSHYLKFQTPER